MKCANLLILIFFLGSSSFGQGLTVALIETDSAGKKSPAILQTERTRARLDLPNGSKLQYNSETKKLHVMFAGATVFTELTPQLVQLLSASRRGQGPAQAAPTLPIAYKRMGSSKVGQWACTVYEGFRGSEKVAEICAAEGAAIALTASDFVLVQEALNSVKGVVPQDVLDGIPTWGTLAVQGYAGFPVRRMTFLDGKTDSTIDLIEFKRGAIPEATFAIPTVPPAAVPATK